MAKLDDSLDKKYVKVSPREHVLLKPSMYLGDTSIRDDDNYIFNNGKIVKDIINWSPAFYKIFDEIIVNAYDQSIRDNTLTCIKVILNKHFIEVSNDGRGIDVEIHKKHKIYIPELIFGNLMSSTNFGTDDTRITGGTHGLGAKLTNIFSKRFEIVVIDASRKLEYTQIFKNNMSVIEKPTIKKSKNDAGGFSVRYYPDFARFGMKSLDDDIIKLFTKRVYDLAGLTEKKIYLNGKKLEINSWKKYLNLYDDGLQSYKCNQHWSMGVKLERNAYQVSFVNGIFTNKNGKHLDYIFDQIYNKYSIKIKDITKKWLKNHITIILKTSVVNPSFNSQTKEELMTPYSKLGIVCDLDSAFYRLIEFSKLEEMFMISSVAIFTKSDGKKKSRIKNIPKLEDANYAGTKKSMDCILILTEGDSAKATAISGISALKEGRNYYGVFPLKGKLLNVREVPIGKVNNNEEIINLKKALGLQSNINYTKENLGLLRYGSIMLMMDADEDGSHIKGLVINFLNYFYPSLLNIDGFLQVLVTPVVKASAGGKVLTFKNVSSYNVWKKKNDLKKFKIKYYKGLGTSTAKEAGEYFTDLPNHIHYITIKETDIPNPDLELVFNKKLADNRKEWLSTYNINKTLEFEPEMNVNIHQFVNLELKHFSNYDNVRSIPHLMDGFKPSQRKVLYACIKRHLYTEAKVAQLAGNVAENTSYHHGENSLVGTIINLAQDFVGSNNINILEPIGQFGTRLLGGNDNSSARYIFTQLSPAVKLLFRTEDDGLLMYLDDDGFKIEPKTYYPVIPFVLVNGSDGIGTGFSTYIPNYNPIEIINNIMLKLDGKKLKDMMPYYKGFKGTIIKQDDDTFISKGIIRIDGNKLHIEELPVKVWTSDYKEFIETLVYEGNSPFGSVTNMSSDKNVHFILKINDMDSVSNMMKTQHTYGINSLEKYLGLYKHIKTSNMHLFDMHDNIKKYNTALGILNEFYKIRLDKYDERKKLLLELLKLDLDIQENKFKWLKLILNGTIDLRSMDIDKIINYLVTHKFSTKDKSYDYLLNMSIKEMSKDNVKRLEEKIKNIKKYITDLKNTSIHDLWRSDLNDLRKLLEK
jgi:DNA topoisomerase-2